MKNVFLSICIVTVAMTGCKSPDKKAEAIKTFVLSGQDEGKADYKSISTENIATVIVQKSIDNILAYPCEYNVGTLDSAIIMAKWVVNDAREKDDTETYNVWSFLTSRLEKLQSLKADDVDYQVIKHSYTVKNPLLDNTIEVTSYFFLDKDDKVLGYVADEDFKTLKRNAIKYDEEPYEQALFHFEKY